MTDENEFEAMWGEWESSLSESRNFEPWSKDDLDFIAGVLLAEISRRFKSGSEAEYAAGAAKFHTPFEEHQEMILNYVRFAAAQLAYVLVLHTGFPKDQMAPMIDDYIEKRAKRMNGMENE